MRQTMMTSWNGNIIRVTGPLWGESTGLRWIPLTKTSDADLWCFLWSAPEQTGEQTIEMPAIWDAATVMEYKYSTRNDSKYLRHLYFEIWRKMRTCFDVSWKWYTALDGLKLWQVLKTKQENAFMGTDILQALGKLWQIISIIPTDRSQVNRLVAFLWVILTYWAPDKMDAILQTPFSNLYSCVKIILFWFTFLWNLFLRGLMSSQWVDIGSDNGMASDRRQDSIWTKDMLV